MVDLLVKFEPRDKRTGVGENHMIGMCQCKSAATYTKEGLERRQRIETDRKARHVNPQGVKHKKRKGT